MFKKLAIFLLVVSLGINAHSSSWSHRVDSLKKLLSEEINDSIKVRLHLSLVYEYFGQDLKEQYTNVESALNIAKNLNDSTLISLAYSELSTYHSILNNYDLALKYIYKATDFALNDKHTLAACLLTTAEVHYFNDDLNKTYNYLRQTLNLSNEIKDTTIIALALHDIGTWHMEYKEYDSALYYISKAHNLYMVYNLEVSPFIASHLGEAYAFKGIYDSALYYLFQALQLDSTYGAEYDVTIDESYISNVYLLKKDYDKAIYYANKSLARAKKLDLVDIIGDNYKHLSETYTALNDYKKALKYSKLSNDYADSLRHKTKVLITQSLEAEYRFDQQKSKLKTQQVKNEHLRKQKKLLLILSILCLLLFICTLIIIQQINQKNRSRQRLLSDLERANSSKDRLISVISHDLRSSVGNLKNSAQIFNDKSIDQESKDELLKSFFPVVDSTFDLLENLLTWANLKKEDLQPSIKKVRIKPLIEKAITHTKHLADIKKIVVSNDLEDRTVLADKNMLSTIVRNLISNAIKFSNQNSIVIISGVAEDNILIVKVEDNGIGISENVLKTIFNKHSEFHSKGTRGEHGSGLGLSICKSFIESMNGAIWAESEPQKGSTFYFSLPVS